MADSNISTTSGYTINPKTILKAVRMNIKEYVDDIQPFVTVDEELIQRLYEPWVMKAIQSYLVDLVSGNAVKDLLLIANLKSIISQIQLEYDLLVERDEDEDAQKALLENIEYFQSFVDKGKKYLLIDGKHRDEVMRRVFKPKNNQEVITFDHESFANLVYNSDGIEQNLVGKRFNQLPEGIQHEIYKQPLLVTLIQSGGIRDLQKFFVTTNSGLQLYPMEIRIASMSVMSRFVRKLTSSTHSPTNHKFFRKMKGLSNTGKKSRLKKGHMLLISQAIGYYLNRVKGDTSLSFNYTSEEYLDKMYDYKFSLSQEDMKLISNVVKTISVGAFELYDNVSKKHKKGKYIKVNWSDWINYFIMISNMYHGKSPYLKSVGKKLGKVNDNQVLFNDLTTILRTLEGQDLYELDSNGNKIQKIDKYGVKVTSKGKPVYIENEHSFKRKNSNITPKNLNDKQVLMFEELDKYIETWNDLGIITLIDGDRSLSDFDKRQQALKQDLKDSFTDDMLSWADVDTAATANSHVTAYADGGTEMVVGNSESNLNSKTEKVY